jgi:hypothetical protein
MLGALLMFKRIAFVTIMSRLIKPEIEHLTQIWEVVRNALSSSDNEAKNLELSIALEKV